jgi:hypothetical protein
LGPLAFDRDAAASGKIATFSAATDELTVFQVMPSGGVTRCWCGNATVAAMVALGLSHTAVIGPSLRRVEARRLVSQDLQVLELTLAGTPAVPVTMHFAGIEAYLLNNLNLYLVTVGLAVELRPEVENNAKVMNVDLTTTVPTVEVRVASGFHGALPMSGGAELALARLSLPWLDEALASGFVRTRNGELESLPTVVVEERSFTLTLPSRFVVLQGLTGRE